MPTIFIVSFREHEEDRDCSAIFDAGQYDPVKVRRFIDSFCQLLGTAVEYPDWSVGSLVEPFQLPPMLTQEPQLPDPVEADTTQDPQPDDHAEATPHRRPSFLRAIMPWRVGRHPP